jgi:thioredoxin 1
MGQNTVAVTDKTFETEVVKSQVPVLVDFWAPWCGPCVALGPTLEELAGEYQGKIKIVKVNVDENPEVPSQFGVQSIPFLAFIKSGKMVQNVVGNVPKAKLKSLIDQVIG